MTDVGKILFVLANDAACITAVVVAGCLALHDKAGWGWFLFVAVCLAGSVRFTK